MRIVSSERGDTIIEVLFAISVFSLIAVGGLSIMNQGTALAQQALEITLVRQQIDAQADALRYLNRAYAVDFGKGGNATKQWNEVVVANKVDVARPFDEVADAEGCHIPPSSTEKTFALDITKLDSGDPVLTLNPDTSQADTYAKVLYDDVGAEAKGIWIQAVGSPTLFGTDDGMKRPGFYDFHIRACWYTPGQTTPMTLGTIVRLYEPRA